MKTLCDWSEKDISKKFDDLSELVSNARYVCRHCARAANKKAALCEPKKLAAPAED